MSIAEQRKNYYKAEKETAEREKQDLEKEIERMKKEEKETKERESRKAIQIEQERRKWQEKYAEAQRIKEETLEERERMRQHLQAERDIVISLNDRVIELESGLGDRDELVESITQSHNEGVEMIKRLEDAKADLEKNVNSFQETPEQHRAETDRELENLNKEVSKK